LNQPLVPDVIAVAFDIGILLRLARLDVLDCNATRATQHPSRMRMLATLMCYLSCVCVRDLTDVCVNLKLINRANWSFGHS
jgi:hypothetical protein